MKINPKTEAQIQKEQSEWLAANSMWRMGEYAFEVLDKVTLGPTTVYTMDTTSKAGSEMIQLALRVINSAGQFRTVIDYLVPSMEYKVRHAAVACGLGDQYESGELSGQDFIGKQGYLKLVQGKARDGYDAKNEVRDYVVPEDKSAGDYNAPLPTKAARIDEDEIPF